MRTQAIIEAFKSLPGVIEIRRPRSLWVSLLVLLLFIGVNVGLPLGGGVQVTAAGGCGFQFGFAVLHTLIPEIVGDCISDEWHDGMSGDGLQQTTGGLLVWRKADNRTAFTDGNRTWLYGPLGLQARLNSERFAWESADRSVQVNVYFSHRPESLDDFGALVPVTRAVAPINRQVATATLEALIAGPTLQEQAAGFFSELGPMLSGVSDCGGADFRLTITSDGVATLRFCRSASSAGVGQDARVSAEIEATLRQFATVRRVRVLSSTGHCLFDASGLDPCL